MAKKSRKNYRGNRERRTMPAWAAQIEQQQGNTMEIPVEFARELLKQAIYNPKVSTSKKSYTYSLYTKENIVNWLQAPSSSSNEKSLRDASNYMYLSSMHYNRLLNYYAGLYVGAYVITPLGFNSSDVKDNFDKQYRKVAKALELMNIPQLLRSELLIALRDGAFYGILVSDSNTAFVQKIDPDYCRITAICDGSFVYQVDMSKISSKLEFYPAEFTEMYSRYLATGNQWQEVPINISVCIKADDTLVDYTIPPFAAVMPSLYTIANTESLQETATELNNYKLLLGKIPLDDRGRPLMGENMVNKYYRHVANAVDENVGVAISPFDFKDFNFNGNNGVKEVDNLANAVANFWSTAGTSGLLHGRENDTSGVTQLAIKNDETYVLGMLQQFERIINRYLKSNFSGTTRFKISMPPITVFNRGEFLKYYKESASFGIGKSYYAAALGLSQQDVAGLAYLEKNLIPFDDLEPLKSSYTESAGDAGRPEMDATELSDGGMEARDNDTNANR